MTVKFRNYFDEQVEYIYPRLDEKYAFRAYPRKFDVKYLNRLPDPADLTLRHYSLIDYPELKVHEVLDAGTPPAEVIIKRVDFRKFAIAFQRDGIRINVYDWEQIGFDK